MLLCVNSDAKPMQYNHVKKKNADCRTCVLNFIYSFSNSRKNRFEPRECLCDMLNQNIF